jgi:hypothetical protein
MEATKYIGPLKYMKRFDPPYEKPSESPEIIESSSTPNNENEDNATRNKE